MAFQLSLSTGYGGTAYRFDVDSRPMYGSPVYVWTSSVSVGALIAIQSVAPVTLGKPFFCS